MIWSRFGTAFKENMGRHVVTADCVDDGNNTAWYRWGNAIIGAANALGLRFNWPDGAGGPNWSY